jgi:hypothetical protein
MFSVPLEPDTVAFVFDIFLLIKLLINCYKFWDKGSNYYGKQIKKRVEVLNHSTLLICSTSLFLAGYTAVVPVSSYEVIQIYKKN